MSDALELAQAMAKTPKVLVIDDDDLIRMMFDKLQKEYDIAIVSINSPEMGLEELRKNEYDVIFLDMKYDSGMDGMDVLRELNRQKNNTHIVVMSGSVNLHDIMSEANQMGVISFMLKPTAFTLPYLTLIFRRLGVRMVRRITPEN